MSIHVVIRNSDDAIVNAVEWGGGNDWVAPGGHRTMLADGEDWAIGGTLTSQGQYTPPPPPEGE